MIPNKTKWVEQYKTWGAVPEEVKAKLLAIPKSTEAQILAQKENFALFQLEGIKSQLRSIEWGLISKKDRVIAQTVLELKDSIEFLKTSIKCIQADRKRARKNKL